MEFSSKLLENAVNEIAQFPGIGKRTALRLALHLLKLPKENTTQINVMIKFWGGLKTTYRNVSIKKSQFIQSLLDKFFYRTVWRALNNAIYYAIRLFPRITKNL